MTLWKGVHVLWCCHVEKMHYFFLKKPHSGHISDLQTNWMNSFGEHRFVFTKFLDPWGRPCQILGESGGQNLVHWSVSCYYLLNVLKTDWLWIMLNKCITGHNAVNKNTLFLKAQYVNMILILGWWLFITHSWVISLVTYRMYKSLFHMYHSAENHISCTLILFIL